MADYRDTLPVLAERIRVLEAGSVNWITIERYAPVERLVYGLTALILVGVVGAIITMVVRSP